ncbi:MAG: NAD(P)-dependent oxidoreductase [Burkholderiales bacterium]
MQVMIVGARGFIGQRLALSLRAAGAAVIEASSIDGSGIDAESGMFSPGFRIAEKVDAIVYLAQSPHYRRVPEFAAHVMAVNTYSAVQLAAAASTAGVKRFIYASTGNVYEPAFGPIPEDAPLRRDNWYALSKVHAEEALELFGDRLDITAVRLFSVYGPGQTARLIPNLVDAVKEGREITIERAPGEQSNEGMQFSLCFIDDVIGILQRLIATHGPAKLNIASDEIVSIGRIASTIGALLGRTPIFKQSDSARPFNLIADISLLKRTFMPEFTPFRIGMSKILEHTSDARSGKQ